MVDPGAKDRPPAVAVLQLGAEGRYEVQAEATGDEVLEVAAPFAVTLRPSDLLAR